MTSKEGFDMLVSGPLQKHVAEAHQLWKRADAEHAASVEATLVAHAPEGALTRLFHGLGGFAGLLLHGRDAAAAADLGSGVGGGGAARPSLRIRRGLVQMSVADTLNASATPGQVLFHDTEMERQLKKEKDEAVAAFFAEQKISEGLRARVAELERRLKEKEGAALAPMGGSAGRGEPAPPNANAPGPEAPPPAPGQEEVGAALAPLGGAPAGGGEPAQSAAPDAESEAAGHVGPTPAAVEALAPMGGTPADGGAPAQIAVPDSESGAAGLVAAPEPKAPPPTPGLSPEFLELHKVAAVALLHEFEPLLKYSAQLSFKAGFDETLSRLREKQREHLTMLIEMHLPYAVSSLVVPLGQRVQAHLAYPPNVLQLHLQEVIDLQTEQHDFLNVFHGAPEPGPIRRGGVTHQATWNGKAFLDDDL